MTTRIVALVDWLIGWLVASRLVLFGLLGFSFNASLEPQPRARRKPALRNTLLLATRFGLGAPGWLEESFYSYAGGGFHKNGASTP